MLMDELAYFAYLLRLQLVKIDGRHFWRASLEEPGTQQQIHFENIQALFAFLRDRMDLSESLNSNLLNE